ncbi:MAG: type IV pilus assembly protein PilB [Candidatus Paceibacteria bacterium]|jgi:type IV pilus assembly protein PilB
MNILQFLADKKILSNEDVTSITNEVRTSGVSVEDILSKRGVPTEDFLKYKAEFSGLPLKSLDGIDVSFDILKFIPEESARHYKIAPIELVDGALHVGLVDPDNMQARDALNFLSSKENLPFNFFLISQHDFEKIIGVYKGLSGQVTKALTELDSELSDEEIEIKKQQTKPTAKKGTQIIEDAPVTKIVATILRYAVEGNSSDVHIEPLRNKVRVRFRVDGVLNTSLVLPIKVHPAVVARIKILSKMRLDEKRKPQDGRFSARIEKRKVDFRVSTFPSYFGEKVVMRILDQEKGVKSIEEIGLSPEYLAMVKNAIKKTYGLILVSGPTGSGKTTTLYSILKEIDKEKLNVLSLEDPVEYSIPGVSQSQVRPDIQYTFANGLRTSLRQDPDVIMVGEIRDAETAALAIQASLTGHLVLSTIHTNTAAGIVPRLVDMGVDPFLIPPTLVLGIAQRLVRKICPGSGTPQAIDGSIKAMIDKQFADLPAEYRDRIPKGTEIMKISPTAECPNGTRGREAVFEMYEMDREMENVILESPVESKIYDVARTKGMITMKEHSLIKALEKTIPFEEVNKL